MEAVWLRTDMVKQHFTATAATPEVKITVQLFTSLNSSCTPLHGQHEPEGGTGKLPLFFFCVWTGYFLAGLFL